MEENEENYLQYFVKGAFANGMPHRGKTRNDINDQSPVKGYIIEWNANPDPPGVPLPASGWMALGLLATLAVLRRARRRLR